MKKNIKETDRQTEGALETQRESADQMARNRNKPGLDPLDSGMEGHSA